MLMPVETVDGVASVELIWEVPVIERVALVGTLLGIGFLGALVLDGLFLSGNGFTWLKIAIIMKVPRPFLGQDTSEEWAQRKREEIRLGSKPLSQHEVLEEDSHAVPVSISSSSGSNGEKDGLSNIAESHSYEELDSEEERVRLLTDWLEETGHSDDPWAEKVLGRQGTSQDN
jgi:hypothetical protein